MVLRGKICWLYRLQNTFNYYFADQPVNDFHPKCTIRPAGTGNPGKPEVDKKPDVEKKTVELKHIHTGDTKVRAKVRFEVVTARVLETGGKKHVVSCINVCN